MTEQTTQLMEKKDTTHLAQDKKHETEHEHKHDAHGGHMHQPIEKKEEKKEPAKPAAHKVKKESAIVRGLNLHMSKRHGMYLCAFIKNKSIDAAIADLEQVRLLKKAVPFKGEIPHRKGKGMMSGRYPVSAAGLMIPMLKTLKGNATVNGLDIDKTRIKIASANWDSRPQRRGGQKGKRTYIILEAKEVKN